MNKEEIYVVIDSESKRLRAIQILTDAGENMGLDTRVSMRFSFYEKYLKLYSDSTWLVHVNNNGRTEITLDQLEQLLNPNFVVKEVVLSIDELQKQAENLGFELVKKERQIKVGDFGKFWDSDEDNINVGFIINIDKNNSLPYKSDFGSAWINFRHLTDEEKKQIQENW